MCGILAHYCNGRDFSTNSLKIIQRDSQPDYNQVDPPCKVEIKGDVDEIFRNIAPKIFDRGTDFCSYHGYNQLELFSSVLSLRKPLTKQPLIGDRFIVQFNGELYNDEIPIDGNDTQFLYNKLVETNGDIRATVSCLHGGFAYCITDLKLHKIYFGKDALGKRALMYMIKNNEIYITSCPPDEPESYKEYHFIECKNSTIYSYDMTKGTVTQYHDPISDFSVNSNETETIKEEALVESLYKHLKSATSKRVLTIFPVHKASARLALLFSGGIDCTLLASLCAEVLQDKKDPSSIDLLNVSFSNPRTKTDPSQSPDRKLALNNWQNLEKRYDCGGCPIQFNLVEMDIPYSVYLKHRSKVISLIYPNDTAMDLSIAIAFYFASGGFGMKVEPKGFSRVPYHSNCKVLLSGLGADELFGGYTKHERIFTGISNQVKRRLKKKPVKDHTIYHMDELISELRDELQHDLSNLYIRNLSRDDKVISNWAKEVRYPYLDDFFIRFVTEKIPLSYKIRYNPLTGEIIRKYALRILAQRMGLDWVAKEPKRAIQFGAKSAKMEVGTGKMKGTDKLKH